MATATVTSKGQVTIPVEVRADLGLHPGSRLVFLPTGTGRYEVHAESGSIRELKGAVPSPQNPVSLEDMDAAIAGGAGASGP